MKTGKKKEEEREKAEVKSNVTLRKQLKLSLAVIWI
jgi:hypothetical protein